ncbi:MAG: hypothetical protein K6F79_02290 [Saccharofermentans sp.]|nr:hypothetical protein [Saccharofermentans sp.]
MKTRKNTITAVFLISVLVMLTACFSAKSKLDSLVSAKKYNEAIQYYLEKKDDISRDEAKESFTKALDQMYQDYLKGKVEINDIANYLNDLEKLNSGEIYEYGRNTYLKVYAVEKSKEAFVDAEFAYKDGQYERAIGLYKQVVSDDTNYEIAQKNIAECIKEYKKLKVAEAEEFAHNGDYKNPIQLLRQVASLIGDDSEINSLIVSYQSKLEEQVVSNAESLINEGKYDEAIELINENQDAFSDSKKFEEAKNTITEKVVEKELSDSKVAGLISDGMFEKALESINSIKEKYPDSKLIEKTYKDAAEQYVKQELAKIEELMSKSDYDAAYDECEKALEKVPDSEEIKSKMAYAGERKPTDLMDRFLAVNAESGAEVIKINKENTFTDKSNVKYSKNALDYEFCGAWFRIERVANAEFKLDKKYKSLRTAAVLACSLKKDDKAYIRIYGDNKLLVKKKIDNHTTADNIIEVDVSNVEILKIEISYTAPTMNSIAVVNSKLDKK